MATELQEDESTLLEEEPPLKFILPVGVLDSGTLKILKAIETRTPSSPA